MFNEKLELRHITQLDQFSPFCHDWNSANGKNDSEL